MRGYMVLLLLPLTLLLSVSVGPARGQEIVALGTLPGLPPVPVMRVPHKCADRMLTCYERTARGECHTRPQDMLVNCAASCGSCLPTDPSECVDRAVGRNCFYAALLGECTANPSYHLAYCAWSCREYIDVCREESRLFGESCYSPKTVRGSTTGGFTTGGFTTGGFPTGESTTGGSTTGRATTGGSTTSGSTTGCGYRGASSSGADLQRRRRSIQGDTGKDFVSEVASTVNDSITSALTRGGPVTVDNSNNTTEGAANRSSLNSAVLPKVAAVPGKAANSSLKLTQKQNVPDLTDNNIVNALMETGLFSNSPFFLYWVEKLSSIFDFLNFGGPYPSNNYDLDWACYPGYAAVGIISLVVGLFNPVLRCEPETTTVHVTQTVTVTVTQTVVSTQQALTQTVTVSSPVRLFITKTFVPPVQTVIRPAVTLPPPPPSTVFVTPPTTTPKPLRPVNDPFVPFCVPKKVDKLREQLKSMIGRNTGRPLPDEAVPLLEAINFCQFGGTLIPEAAKDIFNGQPPANWRGLSTPSLPPPPGGGPARRADEGEVIYVSVPNLRRPRAADIRKDGEPWGGALSGAFKYGEDVSRLRRQGLVTEDSRTDSQRDDETIFSGRVTTNERSEQFINSPGWRPVVQTLMPVFTEKNIDEDANELNDLFSNSVFVLNTSTSGNGMPLSIPAQKGNVTYLRPFSSNIQTDFNPNEITLQVQEFLNRTSQQAAKAPLNNRPPLPAPQLGRPPLSTPSSISSPPLPLLTSVSSPTSPDTIFYSTPTLTELNQNTGSTITEPTQNTGPSLSDPPPISKTTLTELTLDSTSPLPLTIPSIPETSTEPNVVTELEIPIGGNILPAAPGLRDRFWCGGALVTDRHVVTAAHCVVGTAGTGQRPNVIRLGEEDFATADENKAVDFRIEDIAFHPQYRATGEERYYDFALITLADSAAPAFFDPYCLVQSPKVLEGRLGKVSGWGQRPNQKTSEVLLDVPVVINNLKQCEQLYLSHPDFLSKYYPKGFTEALLCASGERPGEDACRGDSGGPLVLQDPLETLVGVVSTGYGCGDPHYPGIYSRVDAYLDWIDAQIFGYCSKVAFEYRNNATIAGLN